MPEKLIGGRAGDREHMRRESIFVSYRKGGRAGKAPAGFVLVENPMNRGGRKLLISATGGGLRRTEREINDYSLLRAAEFGDLALMRRLLKKGADKNATNAYKRTPLIEASWSGMADAVKLLLRNKVGLDARDLRGKTALMYAAECGHVEIVMLLIRAGADADLKDGCGESALAKANRAGKLETIHILSQIGAN